MYSPAETLLVKDIIGLVSEGLLLAKCELISESLFLKLNTTIILESNPKKVEDLLKECEENIKKMKVHMPDLKKEMIEARKEKAENKSVTNDDKSSAYTKTKSALLRNRPGHSSTPTFIDFKWMLSALATIAAFYNAVGN